MVRLPVAAAGPSEEVSRDPAGEAFTRPRRAVRADRASVLARGRPDDRRGIAVDQCNDGCGRAGPSRRRTARPLLGWALTLGVLAARPARADRGGGGDGAARPPQGE